MPRAGWAVAVVASLAVCLLAGGARAQAPAGASDAIILVQPMGYQAMVAVVFPKAVPASAVRGRMSKLARSAGWTLTSLDIKNEQVRTNPRFGGPKGLGTQTDATATMTNAPQAMNGGFLLQPYLDAFSDLKRIEILYMVPPDRGFQGLREFDSPSLSVRLITAGGPYRYVADIKDHSGALPKVPLIQPQPRAETPVAATRSRSTGFDTSAMALVLAIAAGGGLVVLLIGVAVHGRQNKRSPYREQTRRMSRS